MNDDPNLHACNHLYVSDRQTTTTVATHWDVLDKIVGIASLSVTVVFHTTAESLAMYDDQGKERWFCQEVWTDRLEDGRGTHHSRIWDDQGRHIASTSQDCMIRIRGDAEASSKEKEAKSKI